MLPWVSILRFNKNFLPPFQSGKKHQKKLNAPAINSMNSRFSCALCQVRFRGEVFLSTIGIGAA